MARIVDEPRQQFHALARVVDLEGKDVLDVGCGDGRLTLLIAELAASVVGIDPDAQMIEQARKGALEAPALGASFVLGDVAVTAEAWAAAFDVVVFSRSL